MDKKTLELIGIAASIGTGCSDCLDWHLKAAREAGATNNELEETVLMAQRVRSVTLKQQERMTTKITALLHQLQSDEAETAIKTVKEHEQ